MNPAERASRQFACSISVLSAFWRIATTLTNMSIATKFSISWRLAKNCLGVLARNKTLLAFPIVTFFLWIVMAVLFLAPITAIHTGYNIWEAKHWESLGNDFNFTVNVPTANGASKHFEARVSNE